MPAGFSLDVIHKPDHKAGPCLGGSYVGGVPLDSYALFFVCGKFVRKDMVCRDLMGFTMLEKDHHNP